MPKPPAPCGLCEAKKEAGRIVYMDGLVLVVIVREPMKPGHMMVLPARHVREIGDLNADESRAFLQAINAAMHAIEEGFDDPPMCFLNGWKYRTQEHLHVHVLPSKKGQRELVALSEGMDLYPEVTAAQRAKMAKQLRPLFNM